MSQFANGFPMYFSARARKDSAVEIRAALMGLASLMRDRHDDGWLLDILGATGSYSALERAARSLGESESLIARSDDRKAESAAQVALMLFKQARSPAGAIRARLSLSYIFQLQHQTRKCESFATALANELMSTSYAWVRLQSGLEQAACASICDAHELQLAEMARSAALKHRFLDLEIRAADFVAAYYQTLGDRHRAWTLAADSLAAFWNGHYEPRRGYNLLATFDNLAEEQAKWFLQRDVLEEAVPLANEDPNVAIRAIAIKRLGEAQLRSGDVSSAEQSFGTAQQVFAQVPAGIRRDALNAEIEVDLAEAELKGNRSKDAFARLDRVRNAIAKIPDDDLQLEFLQNSGIAAMQTGHENQSRGDLQAAARLAAKGLALVKTEADRWQWSRRNEAEYRALVQLELKSNPPLALLDWEAFKGATLRLDETTHASQSSSTFLPSDDRGDNSLPSDLGSESVLLSYFILPGQSVAWVWDKHGIREFHMMLPEPGLSLLIGRFVEHCSDPSSNPEVVRQEGSALYEELIRPIEDALPGHRQLIIEPDGILRSVPFEALLDAHGRYLGDRFDLTISPGVEYLSRSANWPGISRSSKALIIGDPNVPGWIPLPDAEQEASTVAAMFESPILLEHDSYSTGDLASDIARVQVFHFSGHATATAAYSGLEVGDPNAAAPFNLIVKGPFRTRLVVLSACSSALGTAGQFDDEDSLVRRLMAARVPEVVASRWAVDSAATAALMRAFYSNIFEGQAVSASLANARRELRSQNRFAHPYYWAAFSAFGKS